MLSVARKGDACELTPDARREVLATTKSPFQGNSLYLPCGRILFKSGKYSADRECLLMLVRQRFHSFEEYAASLGHGDVSVLALKRARLRWESARIDLDGVPVRWARDGGPCVFEGAIDLDVVGLMVCVAATGKMIGNGTAFGPGSVMVVPRAHQIRVTSLDAVEWISVLIPTSRLCRTAAEQRALRVLP